MALAGEVGVALDSAETADLFAEDQARYLVACTVADSSVLLAAAAQALVPAAIVGRFGGDTVTFGTTSAPLNGLEALYRTAFASAVG